MSCLAQDHRITWVNLADQDAQAMASPVAESSGNGMLITAADVVNLADDSGQLVPMLEQAKEMTGEQVPVTLADGGYHTAVNLAAGEQRGDRLVMPERYHPGVQGPYFKDEFVYDPATGSYLCSEGQRLPFRGLRRKNSKITGPFRVYRASSTVCRALKGSCPLI